MEIYQHYREDERPFIDQVFDWIDQVKSTYAFKLTDFLNPREQEIITQLVSYAGEVNAAFFGGIERAERKRGLIYPDYFQPDADDFRLSYFQLDYPVKFYEIGHRQLLGALMGLGIKREKIGDLIIRGQAVQFIVASEIAEYIKLHLTSVGKAKVIVEIIKEDELLEPEDDWQKHLGTVSSLRLDAVLAEIFKLSRAKAAQYIQRGYAKINWKVIDQPAYECSISDTISLRGYGRAKLLALDGKSKKGKWRIHYGKK